MAKGPSRKHGEDYYTPEVQAKAEEYVNGAYRERDEVVPSVSGLARYLGMGRTTMHNYRDKYPEFAEVMSALDDVQHVVALNKGLAGEFNSAITKLLLHNHGYSDRQNTEISGPDGGPVKTQNEWVVQPVRASRNPDS